MERDFLDMFNDVVTAEHMIRRDQHGKPVWGTPVLYSPGNVPPNGAHISTKQEIVKVVDGAQVVSGGAVYLPPDDFSISLGPEDRVTFGDVDPDHSGHPNVLAVAIPHDADGSVHHVKVFLR